MAPCIANLLLGLRMNSRILSQGTASSNSPASNWACNRVATLIDATIEQHGNTLDWQYRCSTIQVNSGRKVKGLFYHPHTWREASASGVLSGGNATVDPGEQI